MGLKSRIQNLGLYKADLIQEEAINTTQEPVKSEVKQPGLQLKILSDVELDFKQSLHTKLLDVLDLPLISGIEEKEARRQIQIVLQGLIDSQSLPINTQTRQQIIKEIGDDVLGLGPLEALLYDRTISDILVNGFNKVYVERFGKLELTPVKFNDNNHLKKIIDRIVTGVGRRIDGVTHG